MDIILCHLSILFEGRSCRDNKCVSELLKRSSKDFQIERSSVTEVLIIDLI